MKRPLATLLLLALLAAGCGNKEPARPADSPADDKDKPVLSPKDPGAAELEKLRGDWYVDALEEKGRTAEEARGRLLSIQGDRFTLKDQGGNVLTSGTCKPDGPGEPRKIDFLHTSGQHAGKTAPAIYALEGERLRVCVAAPGAARPAKFATDPAAEVSYLVLTRKKVEPPKFDPAWLDMGRLRGTWVVVEAHEQGRPSGEGKGRRLIFFDEQFNLRDAADKELAAGTCKLVIGRALKSMDLRHQRGPHAGKTVAAIYALDDDSLKVCLAAPDGERPAEFVSKAAPATSLLVLKREEVLRDQAELAKLEGTWLAESVEEKGKPVEEAKGRQFILLGDQLNIKDARGNVLAHGICKPVHGGPTPQLDLLYKGGPNSGQTALLIYALEEDTLKLCLAPPGAERPEAFATKPDSPATLYVLKRKK